MNLWWLESETGARQSKSRLLLKCCFILSFSSFYHVFSYLFVKEQI